MTSKEFLQTVSETLHHQCKVSYERILLDLQMYALYERDHYKEKYGNFEAITEYYDKAFRTLGDILKEKKYYD